MRHLFTFNRILIATIGILILLHILILPIAPPGFFVDEAATGAHVVAMLQHGTNAHHVALPLFSESLGGGYTTPVYLYPLVGWAAVFGTSELALRAFSLASTLLTITLLACVAYVWLGKRAALISVTVALALPWAWLQGSIAWDPALVPLFITLPLLALSLLLHTPTRSIRVAMLVILPLSLIALAYLYPPARVTAPLLFVGAYAVLYLRKLIDARLIFLTCIAALFASLPLLVFMFQPEALERSRTLSVFYDHSIVESVWLTFTNCLQLLSPSFLFVTGDPNLRHSTGVQGMLGLAALPALIALVVAGVRSMRSGKARDLSKNKTVQLLVIALFGVAASLLGSALTNESQPHSLRATAAWPFIVIIITIGWNIIFRRATPRSLQWASALIFILATAHYTTDLALHYPARSSNAFDTPQRQAISSGDSTLSYPPLALQYYQDR